MLVKALLVQAAATLAGAVVSNLPDTLAADPEIANPETKAENLMAYRVTHIFYDGLCAALDPANANRWQSPAWIDQPLPGLSEASPLGQLAKLALGAMAPGGAGASALGNLLPLALKALSGSAAAPAPVASGDIPSPADAAVSPGAVK